MARKPCKTRRCRGRIRLAAGLILVGNAWSAAAGGGDAPPTDSQGAAAPTPARPTGPPPYWQAPALPAAVIQGGPIPPGWQPQAVPYQGIGPDGQPLTMYFAPTYVFTYQAGPPVPASPQSNRRGWWGRPAATAAQPTGGWNYATSGAPPATITLPPDRFTGRGP